MRDFRTTKSALILTLSLNASSAFGALPTQQEATLRHFQTAAVGLFDEQGRLICAMDVSGHPEFVPKFSRPTTRSVSVNAPKCSQRELDSIQDIASQAQLSQYAGLPLVLGVMCAIDVVGMAAVTAWANYNDEGFPSEQLIKSSAVTTSVLQTLSSRRMMMIFQASTRVATASWLGLAVAGVSLVCVKAGMRIGYWIVPDPDADNKNPF